jgi:hypothetical protein
MFKKIDRTKISGRTNLCMFKKGVQERIRNEKKIYKNGDSEFAELSREERDSYAGIIPSKEWRYFLYVDFDEETLESYNGIVIDKINDFESCEIIRIDSGNVEIDEEVALNALFVLEGEVTVQYLSYYDYYMGLWNERKELN